MPGPYGLTATGFNIPTLEEIQTSIEASLRADISPAIDVSPETPLGQLVGIFSSKVRENWEALLEAYNSNFPGSASGRSLAELSKLTATTRRAATYTEVECTVNVDPGTYAIGTLIAHVAASPDSRFANTEAVTNGTAGALTVTGVNFAAQSTGRVVANANTLTVIAEAVTGWNFILNPLDGSTGSPIESDPALRARRLLEVRTQSGSAIDTIRASVLAIVGIEAVAIYENQENIAIGGLPPHSFEAVVYDGTPTGTLVSDTAIGQVIWNKKPAGAKSHGAITATATDTLGGSRSIKFSRPDAIEIHCTLNVGVSRSLFDFVDGKADLRTAIVEYATEFFKLGEDIVIAELIAETMRFPAVTNVNITLGRAAGTQLAADLAIFEREIPEFDTSRITVNFVEYSP